MKRFLPGLTLFLAGLPALAMTPVKEVKESPIAPYQVVHTLHDQLTVLAYHDVREDLRRDFAPDQYAVSAENLAMQFSWLRENHYKVVSIRQVLAALDGGRPLPPKAVLLTFDDGLASFSFCKAQRFILAFDLGGVSLQSRFRVLSFG